MAALDLADIPSNINTYERLAVWALQCLQSISNGGEVIVTQNEPPQQTAQVVWGVTADNVPRFILSAYLPLDRDGLNDPNYKTWMACQDISQAQPHTNLLSN